MKKLLIFPDIIYLSGEKDIIKVHLSSYNLACFIKNLPKNNKFIQLYSFVCLEFQKVNTIG